MKQGVTGQPAYVLHTRPFRETSAIVDLLTPEYGRIGVVARGVRGTRPGHKKNADRSLLQPFRSLLVSWYGRGELKNLRTVEEMGKVASLQGRSLLSALYINELLSRLLRAEDDYQQVYKQYQRLLAGLGLSSETSHIEPLLRNFEQNLLQALGYGIPFPEATESGADYYCYHSSGFFIAVDEMDEAKKTGYAEADITRPEIGRERYFTGQSLQAIKIHDYRRPGALKDAKRLMRLALQPLIGDRPLKSRELFVQQKEKAGPDNV